MTDKVLCVSRVWRQRDPDVFIICKIQVFLVLLNSSSFIDALIFYLYGFSKSQLCWFVTCYGPAVLLKFKWCHGLSTDPSSAQRLMLLEKVKPTGTISESRWNNHNTFYLNLSPLANHNTAFIYLYSTLQFNEDNKCLNVRCWLNPQEYEVFSFKLQVLLGW